MTDEELEAKIADLAPKVEAEQKSLGPNDDMWGSPNAQELLRLERARSSRKLNKIHPGNRFRLMFGQPMLPEEKGLTFNIKVETECCGDIIQQTVTTEMRHFKNQVSRYLINTKDSQVREVLIKLGWTPPQS